MEEFVLSDISFSNFVYIDTNIYSHLANTKSLWKPMRQFLLENDLCIGFGEGNLVELADATRKHEDLVDLLLFLPVGAIKPRTMILQEEMKSHPQRRKDPLLLYPFNKIGKRVELMEWFTSERTVKVREEQLYYAKQARAMYAAIKENFPPSKTGNYVKEQAPKFASFLVIQSIGDVSHDFLAQFKDRVEDLNTDVFLSIRIVELVIYYKYYLGGREPDKISDFGDLFHLHALPYCKLAIMERDQCNILNQIKKHSDVLVTTTIKNNDFLTDWDWSNSE